MIAVMEKHYQKSIREIMDADNMSKKANIKNQNKLKVYLSKIKPNDLKPNSKGNNNNRQRP
jgi:flagellar biosynthesis protein FliP